MTDDEAPRRAIGWQILAILGIALLFRLIMAYGLDALRGSGFRSDLDLFRFWADNLASQGPFGFYDRGFFADYTPGYLYALWLVGIVGHWLGGIGDLIKLPAILTDVALGFVVYLMVRDLGVTERRATLAAAVVVLNPITWFDSVIWGQVDSFGTVFLLLAVRELWKGRTERSAILAVVAALVKPQLAILVPIVAVVTIRRALWPDGGWGAEGPPEPSGFGWERRARGPIRILSTGVAGFVTAVLLALPFGLSVVNASAAAPFLDSSLLRLLFSTAATYSYVTVNAYNLWALFPIDGQSLATNAQWLPDAPLPDWPSYAAFGPVPAVLVGSLALVAVAVVVSFLVARRPDRLTILVGVCALALAFFGVPTRVHERYLFPWFALAAIPIAFSARWRIAYAVASVATFLNMYVVLTTLYTNNPSISDWLGIGSGIRSFWGVVAIALMNTGVLVWGLLQLRSRAAHSLDEELASGRVPDRWSGSAAEAGPAGAKSGDPRLGSPVLATAAVTDAGAGPPVLALAAAGAAPSGSGAAGALGPPRRLLPAWFDRPSWANLGPFAWLTARINETPIRPDRSAGLAREGGGRLDRLDLWILVVLVVAAMGLRMFRLAEPARMHFDEVYHARTAAEFLQDWRYGISHDIYEWTHPHLAKYAMALGIVLFAGHDVDESSDLGIPVRDATIEPRRASTSDASAILGERAWVATGSGLAAYDLHTRKEVGTWSVPGAVAVTWDPTGQRLLVGTEGGELLGLDVTQLDGVPAGSAPQAVAPETIGTFDGPVARLAMFDDGATVAALLSDGRVAVMDAGTGEVTGTAAVRGAVDLVAAGQGDALIATRADVTDPAAAASELAGLLGGKAADYERQLTESTSDTVVLDATLDSENRKTIQAAIDGGRLAGVTIGKVSQMAVAGSDGVTLVTPDGVVAAQVGLAGGARGVALVRDVEDGTQLYAPTVDPTTEEARIAIIAMSGSAASDGPTISSTMRLPGAGSRIVYDDSAQLLEVVGVTPDGSGTTAYVIEPHGKTVFADHKLPFVPAALALDHDADYPTSNRDALLAFSSSGTAASLDVGHYPFAWRLPGVIMGAFTMAALYLLARVLFRRREIGVLVGLFALLDGMFFVQSRIAMNDVYTGAFIVAAYALFAWLWLERRPGWTFWTLMPVVGLLLGLALASKWVAAYAIGALGILILVRSALGRLLLIFGLVLMTGFLGWLAIAVPAGSNAPGNLTFVLIMTALTLATVVLTVYRPVAWSDEEVRIAVGGPPIVGLLGVLVAAALGRADRAVTIGPISVTPLEVGFALVVAGGLAYVGFQVAGRLGFGPMAPAPAPDDPRAALPPASPAPEGWLRLGSGLGLPIVWMVGSLLAIPLAVYVISYIPWALVENHVLFAGWPPGHTGQTLVQLTGEMYRYHNDLTTPHPASSPWWAWPLNLKPVWFYQGGFANDTAASIYDAGNVVLWWMGIPAMLFAAYQAYRRRSLALALILVGYLCQWIAWARIDRAAFQYHYYTSLPFLFIALAYFVAEVWHGASRRVWLLARASAAVALLVPVMLWLLRQPLCGLANVQAVNAGSQACNGNPGNLVVTPATAALSAVVIVGLIVLIRLFLDLARPREDGRAMGARELVPLVLVAIAAGVALAATRFLPSDTALLSVPGIVPELIALLVAVPLGLVALQLLMARDARRFAGGFVIVVAVWFVILYPNIAALPLPSTLVNAYQGLLPTYLYAFQFSVDTLDRSGAISFADPKFAVMMLFLVVLCVVVAYSAWTWRLALADRGQPTGESGGEAGAAGQA